MAPLQWFRVRRTVIAIILLSVCSACVMAAMSAFASVLDRVSNPTVDQPDPFGVAILGSLLIAVSLSVRHGPALARHASLFVERLVPPVGRMSGGPMIVPAAG